MNDVAMTKSGYERIQDDSYFTIEEWCTEAIMETVYKNTTRSTVWEPACGERHMANVIERYGFPVVCSDISERGYEDFVSDFTKEEKVYGDHIITNPPYEKKICEKFVRHAVKMIEDKKIQSVSMLLRNEWDCAKGRKDLFADNPYFSHKVVLLKRPRWFEKRENDSSPRHNYCWLSWRASKKLDTRGPEILYYDPS